MKHRKIIAILQLLILAVTVGYAQESNDPNNILWEKVQELENDDLTKSALAMVQSISEKAKKEKNSSQTVKALLFTSKYALILEEDAQLNIITNFRSEIEKAEFPVKNVLQSYLANMYWQYFRQNRYQFYDRTKTQNKVDSIDFRTWDLATLFHEISIHFDASLENKEKLQKTGLDDFKEILNTQSGSGTYRSTLYDVLAHTALDFYKTDENNITRPADQFEITDPELLCEAYSFTQLKIDTNDPTSLQSKALGVFQELLKFHISDAKLDALIDVDIERLDFIFQNAVFANKDEVYIEVLQNSTEHYKQNAVSGLYGYEIAKLLVKQGDTYAPNTNEDERWKQKEALKICDTVIGRFPKGRAAEKCKALKSQILATQLQLTAETNIPINTDARILVHYKNIESLQFSAFQISQKQLTQLNELYREPEKLKFLQQLRVVKTWETSLKNENDYQGHSIEVLLPALSNGQYVILAAPVKKGTGKFENKTFAFSPVQVTDLAVVSSQLPETYKLQVIRRGNGRPISDAKVQLTYRKNNDQAYTVSTFTTNANGMIDIPLSDTVYRDVTVEVDHKDDTAYFGEFYLNRRFENEDPNKVTNACFLFTDRSIYRPGQPVYFKGILMETFKASSKVLPEQTVFVRLDDVNGQKVSELELETNAFGSFNGEFILPTSGLTGEYSIRVDAISGLVRENHYFSVEEYKRPKFETAFEPVTDTFRVNDSITVKGIATAYAGSFITDAKVSYRVKRVVYYPWWSHRWSPHPEGAEQEIAHGETTTDSSGQYEIDFKALPDTSLSKENLPTFQYEVTADVTDINGETHSATSIVSVGYHAVNANINVPDRLDKNSKTDTLTISTSNLNNQPIDTRGTLKMYKLQAPDQVLRPRPWLAPDYEQWEKADFNSRFPNETFANEDNTYHWDKGELVWESDFDTGRSTEFALKLSKKWDPGKYLIELQTTDIFGQKVKALAQTTLYSDTDKKLADNQLFQIWTDKKTYDIGDMVEVLVASASKDLTVSVFVEKDSKIISTHVIRLNENTKSFTVPVTDADLGGFAINYSYAAYNFFTSGSLSISVPYPKTDLKIETLTFRDKLAPGTDETWAFTIKGPKGDAVSAELLASMYDISLDAFADHTWRFNPLMRQTYYSKIYTNGRESFGVDPFRIFLDNDIYTASPQFYDTFEWFEFQFGHGNLGMFWNSRLKRSVPVESVAMEMMADESPLNEIVATSPSNLGDDFDFKTAGSEVSKPAGADDIGSDVGQVQIRRNLQETAFFFPQLKTDAAGKVTFNFTTPEALTQWKLQLLAHTKSLESAVKTMETVTQKELMVIPNAPRFLREGDEISISTKIANLTEKLLSGQAELVLTDAVTAEDITKKLGIPASANQDGTPTDKTRSTTDEASESDPLRNFKVDSMGNTQVSWRLKIPEGVQAVQYKIIAKAGDFSDGEQNLLPVLTNRMLVTETLPMWVRSEQTKTFTLDKLKDNTSTTLRNHKLTLEITSNPAWYAVQALPYLMEYPYDCNEQTFARYYANALATHIAKNNPRIQEVFKQWANSDALIGNLEKNEELKSLLIQETPWLRDAQSEAEQKKRIALLFNLDKMKNEKANALNKLRHNQNPSGAWSWFNGGPDNRFITQHIVTGMGHLEKLTSASLSDRISASNSSATSKVTSNNAIRPGSSASGVQNSRSPESEPMLKNAIAYLDAEFVAEYEIMKKQATDINDDHLSPTQIHYLYMRSFFPDIKTSKKVDEISAYYKSQAQRYWTKKGLYPKGMLALALHRMNDTGTSNEILRALKENSITSEELGMYWKENKASWHAYKAPIETQAVLIEAFGEIQNDTKTIDNLKVWLLKNKQTHQWKTTKATTEAVYALLLQGSDWLSVTDAVDVLVGGKKIEPSQLENVEIEAGTGYYKTAWNTKEIKPKMAEVQMSKKGKGIAWGALYWQYFEDFDKITSAETPLQLKKKLFLKTNTDTGEEISEVTDKTNLTVGDLVRVRIELRSDRDMEFLHMKDTRAAGFEPLNVLSQYKWQDGLGYYESTKDASTNFFFDYLPKGVYVFEYDLRVNNAGEFSNGITTIQSMYAPEFSSHSEGVRVEVKG